MSVNEFGQPVGEAVPGWSPRPTPAAVTLVGDHVRVEPLAKHHLPGLFDALIQRSPEQLWTYLPAGPFEGRTDFDLWLSGLAATPGVVLLALCDTVGRPLGIACYQRPDTANGVVEVGHIVFGVQLQRTVLATEAMYLLARNVFEALGYRRYEWKCDDLNEASKHAATRLGFTYEGCFRQAVVYKGRNRDTAWFAMTDRDWPGVRTVLETWLAAQQNAEVDLPGRSLTEMMKSHRETGVP